MICVAPGDMTAADRLATLHRACFERAWTAEAIAGLMDTPGAVALEDQDGDRLRGFILARAGGGEAEILTLAVAPADRRQGIATALVEAAAARLASDADTLWLEAAADNEAALALYAGIGFQTAGRRPGYYRTADGARADAVVMRRTLNTAAS